MTRRNHQLVRFFSLAVAVSSVAYMGARSNVFADVTEEGLSEITPETLGQVETRLVSRR